MNVKEYLNVVNFNYQEYCEYLQNKYGLSKYDYMTKSFNKNPKCTRTKEGLIVHHMDEDKMIMLSEKNIAANYPFEWQTKERLVYCDYLEHLLVHILICKYPSPDRDPIADVGIGGVVNFIVPELNDMYCGWQTKQEWRKNCHDKVSKDFIVYLMMLNIFMCWYRENRKDADVRILFSSFNEQYGLWDRKKNMKLYAVIKEIWDDGAFNIDKWCK